MKAVGIIANARSGKDIRRLVSSASVFGDGEKINILKRLLMSLDASGVEQVLFMPDPDGLTNAAIRDTGKNLTRLRPVLLPLPAMTGDYRDSLRAAEAMAGAECACIITLGGDGTNRVVAGACGAVPLLPISAGTNNVFPCHVEATIAGLAAAAFAHNVVTIDECSLRRPLLELHDADGFIDIALVDMVVVDEHYVGARAVWEPGSIRDLFLARARPGDIGLSSIGAALHPMDLDSGLAMHIRTGVQGERVMAPIAPGLIKTITVSEYRLFGPEEAVPVSANPGVIALDGEREITIEDDSRFNIRLNPAGPRVIDIEATLNASARAGFMRQSLN